MILPFDMHEWPDIWLEQYVERAAIMEYMGNMTRQDAEKLAEAVIRKMANEGEWESIT